MNSSRVSGGSRPSTGPSGTSADGPSDRATTPPLPPTASTSPRTGSGGTGSGLTRRKPLARGKPLERGQGPKADPAKTRAWQERSRKALPQESARRKAEKPLRAKVRAEVLKRDGGCRARGLLPGRCASPFPDRPDLEVHEIVARGRWAKGYLVAENCAALCQVHHDLVTREPDLARSVGLYKSAPQPGLTPEGEPGQDVSMTSTATVSTGIHVPTGPAADIADAAVVSRRLGKAGVRREIRRATRVRGYHVTDQEGFTARNLDAKGWVIVSGLPEADLATSVTTLCRAGYFVKVTEPEMGSRRLIVAGRYGCDLEA